MSDISFDETPSPEDFVAYLPYACMLLSVPYNVIVRRAVCEPSHTPTDRKGKSNRPRGESGKEFESKIQDSKNSSSCEVIFPDTVLLTAVYERNDKLVQIQFDRRCQVPRSVLKIINLIIPFHHSIQAITISHGIESNVVLELAQLLKLTNISEISLDYSHVPELNYYLLLDELTNLRNLSLARCKINDTAVKLICMRLVHPQPGSRTLQSLNLTMNSISDIGAEYIGTMLRTNRKIAYLNVSGNTISDKGARAILTSFLEFPLTAEEIIAKRYRRLEYLKEKKALYEKHKLIKETKDRRPTTAGVKKGKMSAKDNVENLEDIVESLLNERMGLIKDPYKKKETVTRNEHIRCLGNNTLVYLNISYNNLTYVTLDKVLEVFKYQRQMSRNPFGLVKIVLEGNYIPYDSQEMREIDSMLDASVGSAGKRRPSVQSRKKLAK